MRRWRDVGVLVVLAAMVAFVATGCLRTDVTVHVNDDRTGSIDLDVYFSSAALDEAGISSDDLIQLVERSTTNIDGVEVSALATADAKGFRVRVPFDDVDQLASSLVNSDLQGRQVRAFSEFHIAEGSDGAWSLNATVDPVGLDAVMDQVPPSLVAPDLDPAVSSIEFTVDLPGKVARSNAERTDGGTATWTLSASSGSERLFMENEPAGMSPLQMLLLGAGALMVVGFLLILFTAAGSRRRRRRRVDHGPGGDGWKPASPSPTAVRGGRDLQDLPVLPTLGGSPPVGAPPPGAEPAAAPPVFVAGVAPQVPLLPIGTPPVAPTELPVAPIAPPVSAPAVGPAVAPPVAPSAAPPVVPPAAPPVVPPVVPPDVAPVLSPAPPQVQPDPAAPTGQPDVVPTVHTSEFRPPPSGSSGPVRQSPFQLNPRAAPAGSEVVPSKPDPPSDEPEPPPATPRATQPPPYRGPMPTWTDDSSGGAPAAPPPS